jgi:NADH:ubiquinone oxidoreductase subunit K
MALSSLFGLGVVLVLIVGFYSLVSTRNLIRVLIAMEVLTKGVTLLLVAAGYAVGRIALAQALAITLIIIEVAVVVVAIGVILCFYRQRKSLDTALLRDIKG